MPDVEGNLLTEPLLTVQTPEAKKSMDLPSLLERLGRGGEVDLGALQAHQQHPAHAFLVQLAAMVVHDAGDGVVTRTANDWRARLRTLAGGRDEPFCLVVPDLALPAFFQPPVPDRTIESWSITERPDEIDVLVLAKNHDVKSGRMRAPTPEHWALALLSLQTTQGFSGRDNYGISRMNGGFGSRPCVTTAAGTSLGERFARDVRVWLEARSELTSNPYPYLAQGGQRLLWTVPWDGKASLALGACDPFYIEICRRVRLARRGAQVIARTAPSKAARLDSKETKGVTGDVWTPVDKSEAKSLTLSGNGFHYALMQSLLFDENWKPGAAQALRQEDGQAPIAIARALVRGQGKTEGLHERILPIPSKARRFLAVPEMRAKAGALAKRRVETARSLRLKVLKPALLALAQGGPESTKFDDSRMDAWLDAADRSVDAIFFGRLFADADAPAEEADRIWAKALLEIGRTTLETALQSTPLPAARRYRAIAAAERTFMGCARKQLERAFDEASAERGEKDE